MYLSKLEIFGFKSFANKTNVILNDGITAIVGPNGCGKTNIVDALRWALGEQRYTTLRSDKMEDVIFNGSRHRKPINLSEVSLTIENNKGILPLDYNEITITRRLYRSGESEYLMNKTVCRLKDIVTLFMDTGMGANAYSVIELKMVETILSDKMDERRKLFEEAAGVTKYKARRKEALRKLADVEADLLRVDDIIAEVRKTVNSLNRQAKKAERYNEYQERLRTLELDVLQRDFNSLFLRLEPLEERLKSSITERDGFRESLEQEESLMAAHRGEARDIEQRVSEHRSAHNMIVERIGEASQDLLVREERERSLVQRVERLTDARSRYENRISEIEEGKRDLTVALERSAEELNSLEERSAELRSEYAKVEERLAAKKLEAESRQARRMDLVQELSRLNNEEQNLRSRISSISQIVDGLLLEEDEASGRLEELRGVLSQEDQSQTRLSETVLAAEQEFRQMEEHKQALRNEIDTLQGRAFEIQGEIGEKMTRIDFLNGLVERLEGYNESVQHLLRNRDWSTSRFGTIADAVNTEDKYRVAIEAALGDAAHFILVNDVNEAVSGLQRLKDTRKGKATFACLDRIPETAKDTFPIAGDGILGWASDLVTYDSQYTDLFNMLLRRVLIVRDGEVANGIIREYPHVRCVTLAGDMFDSNGLIRGGSHSMEEGSLIGKKDQIALLTRQVAALKEKLHENQDVLEEKNLDYAGIDLRHYADRIKQTQQELSAHERRLAETRFEVEKNERVLQKNSEERARLQQERSSIEQRLDVLEPELERLRGQQESINNEMEEQGRQLTELEREYNVSNERFNAANVDVVQKRAEIQNLRNEFERMSRTLHETEQQLEQASSDIVQSQDDAAQLVDDIRALREQITALEIEKNTSNNALTAIEEELAAKKAEIESLDQALHNDREKHSRTVDLVHDMELKVTEIKQKIESMREHALEDYEMDLQRTPMEEDDVFDLGQAKEEINDLRIKIRSLGPVNPLAFEEWKEENDRLELLTTQHQDLTESRQTLTDTIREINETAKKKFSETFAEIRQNFIKIFKSLFDEGDEADLIIEENDDPLEARIEITAKPRGKRPHSIDMLSGGEKTLTAISLLFAIYLVKPSPFCILDEVDAPLDDANIDRFIRILRDFSNNTQFIVVTHNKRTMAAADMLYGVTMEEEGVSKLVAVDFNSDDVSRFAQN